MFTFICIILPRHYNIPSTTNGNDHDDDSNTMSPHHHHHQPDKKSHRYVFLYHVHFTDNIFCYWQCKRWDGTIPTPTTTTSMCLPPPPLPPHIVNAISPPSSPPAPPVMWHFHHASLPSFAILTNPDHSRFCPLTPDLDLNICGLRWIFC